METKLLIMMNKPGKRQNLEHYQLKISNEIISQLTKHCMLVYPEEACGLLVGKIQDVGNKEQYNVNEIIPLENIAEEREKEYLINPHDFIMIEERLSLQGTNSIIGIYHSHPDSSSNPSKRDTDFAWNELVYLIIGKIKEEVNREMKAWKISREGVREITIVGDSHPTSG